MTEELFLEDAYLKEFEARVVVLHGREVVLDRTASTPAAEANLGTGAPSALARSARTW